MLAEITIALPHVRLKVIHANADQCWGLHAGTSQSDYKADGVIFDLHILQPGPCSTFRWSARNDNTPPDIDQSSNEVPALGGRLNIARSKRRSFQTNGLIIGI